MNMLWVLELCKDQFQKINGLLKAPKYVAPALDTFLSFTNAAYGTVTESHETYVRDGVTL